MPTMALVAGVPETVGACGAPRLTPEEPTPGAPLVRVDPPSPTPTWPQPARIAVANMASSR